MYALPSARVQPSRPIDVYNKGRNYVKQPLQPTRGYARPNQNHSHDVRIHDKGYMPSKPVSRSNSRSRAYKPTYGVPRSQRGARPNQKVAALQQMYQPQHKAGIYQYKRNAGRYL